MTDARPDILRKAANVVRKGWVQGELEDYLGRHCALGALREASAMNVFTVAIQADPLMPEIKLLAELIGGATDQRVVHSTLTAWNDADDRTADDVITLLEQAAEKAEADR